MPPARFWSNPTAVGRDVDRIGRAAIGVFRSRCGVADLSQHHHHRWLGSMLATIGLASLMVVSHTGLMRNDLEIDTIGWAA